MRARYGGVPDEPKFGDVIKIKEYPRDGATFLFVGHVFRGNPYNAFLLRLTHHDYPDRLPQTIASSEIEQGNISNAAAWNWSHYREEPDE